MSCPTAWCPKTHCSQMPSAVFNLMLNVAASPVGRGQWAPAWCTVTASPAAVVVGHDITVTSLQTLHSLRIQERKLP